MDPLPALLVFLVIVSTITPPTLGLPTVQCAQTGAFAPISNWKCKPGGPLSIGVKKYESKYCGAIDSGWIPYNNTNINIWDLFMRGHDECPYIWHPQVIKIVQLCDAKDQLAKMRVHSVQQTDSNGTQHVLSGWLHIEVELVDPTDTIRMIYAQVNDEHFNSIGEFVTDPAEQCESSNPEVLVSPSPYQYIPCNAIGAREAKPSQALYMVAQEDLFKPVDNPVVLPAKDLKASRGVHFTWRLNEYWCSRHLRFRPEVFILTTKQLEAWRIKTNNGAIENTWMAYGGYVLYRKMPNMWFRTEWFGAADIKHPGRGPLQCDKLVINETTKNLSGVAPWLIKHPNFVYQDSYHRKSLHQVGYIWQIVSCQPRLIYGESNANTYPTFGGRCHKEVNETRYNTSSTFLQTCNTNASSPEFTGLNVTFTKYRNYTFDLNSNRSLACENPCRAPQTVEDAIEISNKVDPVKNGTDGFTVGITHKHRSKISIAKFWKGRKFHGVLCLIVTMFLMPVSNFMARYYKETFMDYQYHGVHIWFWVHSGASFGSLALLICGQIALGQGIESWGRSQSSSGVAHHSFGWISILVFVLMIILGKLRNAKKKWLKVFMVAHAAVGFTLYIFNIIQIGLSIYIPSSPSLRRCGKDGLPTGISPTLYIAMAWTLIDVVFHVFLTALQMTADRTLFGIRRPMYFPIMPILSPHSHVDMKRAGLRKLLLILYAILSALFTLAATFHLAFRYQPEGCIVGEMSCKAALGCTPVGLAMCKKLKYSICTKKGRKVIL